MNEVLAPHHVAIIMDGNGRWATSKSLSRSDGHKAGVETVRDIVRAAPDLGIKYLTLYAFSSENWKRPENEVSYLMGLIKLYLRKELSELNKNGVCLKIIGNRSKLPLDIREEISRAEEVTKNNDNLTLIIALSYGGRADIVDASRAIAEKIKLGEISLEDINEDLISSHLSTAEIPDPDLMIRTSGEQRISNFLMWQLSYSELYFTDIHWPDFSKEDLLEAIEAYKNRDRRLGKVSKG